MALIVISDWETGALVRRGNAGDPVDPSAPAELPHILPEQDVISGEVRWPAESSFHDILRETACVTERPERQHGAARRRSHQPAFDQYDVTVGRRDGRRDDG